MNPIIISVAPNGARKTKAHLPNIPITPEELVIEAEACIKAGVSLFHLHVRNEDESHSLDPKKYKNALSQLKSTYTDQLIWQISTETCGIFSPSDQHYVINGLNPEAVSIGVREFIPDESWEAKAKTTLQECIMNDTFIQYICYSPEDIEYFHSLTKKNIIPNTKAYSILFVLGKKTGEKATVSELAPFIKTLKSLFNEDKVIWSVCAFGEDELDCMIEAITHGGNVRIGFENNHVLANKTIAPNNAALIRQFVKAAKKTTPDRTIATTEEAQRLYQKTTQTEGI
jgi:uncharacterized protein (DUF849 family)